MALFNVLLKSNAAGAIALGVGAAVLAPTVVPAVARAAKPFAKAAIKGGLVLYVRSKEMLAELGEVAEDAYAEATAEFDQEFARESASETPGENEMAEAAEAAEAAKQAGA
jgi:hypothetical protein